MNEHPKDGKVHGMNCRIDSRCGLHCTGCEYIASCGCQGCMETQGHPFHGECPVAVCCQEKGFVHCGECPAIPCALLQQYSNLRLIPVAESVRQHTAPGIAFDGCTCQNLQDARRFYPHTSRGEGQFMAVLQDTRPAEPRPDYSAKAAKPDPVVEAFLRETLTDYDPAWVRPYGDRWVYASPDFVPDKGVAFSYGITIGEVRKNYVQPHHQFFMALGHKFRRKIELAADDPRMEAYLRGQEIDVDCDNGWAVITTAGCTVGGVKVSGGRAKNHYPKGLRKV